MVSNCLFLGYTFLGTTINNRRTYYRKRCAAGHITERLFRPNAIIMCQERSHPYCARFTLAEAKAKIESKWAADRGQWKGYKLISLTSYWKPTTDIKCGRGHTSIVRAYNIINRTAGCTIRCCINDRIMKNMQKLKSFVYKDKVYL